MKLSKTDIPGVRLIAPLIFKDRRGSLTKNFSAGVFKKYGLACEFRESFYSSSRRGVLRGMHIQLPPNAYAKLVTVLEGKVLDVVLDLRRRSPAYGRCAAAVLEAGKQNSIYIPEGVAHGFLCLSERAVISYHQTCEHAPANDTGVKWDSFGMDWKIKKPILSRRDKALPPFKKFNSPF